ncbi:hypothetical protein GCM10011352_24870 [Marinobacterium zhoushanense]|uniref:SnoaL-like domain-containing protein n=1 Tax=Marinobacterium zhoushanense TaxID=1679163 RepID=A0ABQ1KIG4_9GAMM|nr:nuclear transport factor 2 family protein [Marinobacterium zhoushanense]GGB97783.1 hypothetical protein GCM10011352_24870 [Marinobacterium zhoushanense]
MSVGPQLALLIESACKRLVLESLFRVDQQDYAGLTALFTEQARLYRPTAGGHPLVGRQAIFDAYAQRPGERISRHLCSNQRVDIDTAKRARVHSYAQVFSALADSREEVSALPQVQSPVMIGEFEDICVLEQGSWLIAERRARFVMQLAN